MKARKAEGLDPGSRCDPTLPGFRTRLDELRGFARGARAGAVTAQHDMRIAAKRLRYVLEVVGSCFGPEAEAARVAAKDLQSVLGDIHDCDVMLPKVEGSTRWALLRTRRELLFRVFCDLWQSPGE